jgi:predicted dehydrogenase
MSKKEHQQEPSQHIDHGRRELLTATATGIAMAALGGAGCARADQGLRWGVVGTGGIANAMAPMIQLADNAQLAAVSSRRMESAEEFAGQHDVGKAFDDWREMIAWDGVDVVYIATPTFVREEIAIAAANSGKHVLGEKPFANLPSLQRITAACRTNGVGFMDGTHFPHHPRTANIKARIGGDLGWPWSVDSAFQFGLDDTSNIRLQPDLEPYGAIGDTGWYNMRAAVEYTSPGVGIESCDAYLRRHPETNAVSSASGIIRFDDGSTSTFNCGFESGAGVQDLRISGNMAVIKLDDFLRSRREDHAGAYQFLSGWRGSEEIVVPSPKPAASLMFQDFADMLADPEWMEASMLASERTQAWLDIFWESAAANES